LCEVIEVAKWLYRLGRACARRRFTVVAIWAVLLAAAVAGVIVSGAKTNDEFTIPGSQSQQALDLLSRSFPAASGTSAQIVFVAPQGSTVTSVAARLDIDRVLAVARKCPQVVGVVSPFSGGAVSRNGRVALAEVLYPVERSELRSGTTATLEESVSSASAVGDLRAVVGGNALGITGVRVGPDELVGVAVALVVLLVMFGSVLAAGMTVFSALLGVAIGLAGLLSLTKVFTISSTAPTLALMIGLAVGMDYTLLILSRHRAQLAAGAAVAESIGHATGTSGAAVTFAGMTVVIAMASLAVVDIPFLTVMGLAAALTVAIAVLIALTLLPAVLSLAGERLRPRPGSRAARSGLAGPGTGTGGGSLSARWARFIVAKPLATVAVVVLGLLVLAVPARDLSLAMPDNGTASPGSGARAAYDLISQNFGPGLNGPLLLLVEPRVPASEQELLRSAALVRAEALRLPDVAAAAAPELSPHGTVAIVEVVPRTGPAAAATNDLVNSVRKEEPGLEARTGSVVRVTGTTAVSIDVSSRLGRAFAPFAAVVVGLALVILLLVFRSVVVPLKAALGFLLSVAAALGTVTAVFQWGWLSGVFRVQAVGPLISFLPLILVAVLFGLAMDYEVFLVSRIREDYMVGSSDPRTAVLTGFHHVCRVVVAAALVMFSVFASFASANDSIVKPIALAAAAGILVDAFLVRMTIVPAVLALLGRWAWWLPGWLDRLLPHVDVEGRCLAPLAVPPSLADGTLAAIGTFPTEASVALKHPA
jgi:RND superfamily putative drug exporter